MSTDASRQPLVALCAQCGAEVALALSGPLPSCRHCGNAQPLAPEIASKLAAVRGRLEQRGAQQRQMTGRLILGATSYHGMAIAIMITTWVMFGGMALGFALHGEPGFLSFAFRSVADMDLAGRWWVAFGVAVGLPSSIAALGLATFWLRGLARGALPLPPAQPGGNPRCRCCGAELPSGAALRRCSFCEADNLVVGAQYQKAEGELDAALGQMAARFEESLASRIRRAENVLWAGSLVPVGILLVALPVGLVSGVTRPGLWPVALVAVALAVVAVLLPRLRRLPPIDPLECLALGGRLHVEPKDLVVGAELLVAPPGQAPALLHVCRHGRDEVSLLRVEPSPKGPKTTVWDLKAGGEPLAPEERERLVPAHLARADEYENVTHGEAVALWDGADLRLWDVVGPEAGDVPAWTARRRSKRSIVFAS